MGGLPEEYGPLRGLHCSNMHTKRSSMPRNAMLLYPDLLFLMNRTVRQRQASTRFLPWSAGQWLGTVESALMHPRHRQTAP